MKLLLLSLSALVIVALAYANRPYGYSSPYGSSYHGYNSPKYDHGNNYGGHYSAPLVIQHPPSYSHYNKYPSYDSYSHGGYGGSYGGYNKYAPSYGYDNYKPKSYGYSTQYFNQYPSSYGYDSYKPSYKSSYGHGYQPY